MIPRIILSFLTACFIFSTVSAQVSPKTVVFKVRKQPILRQAITSIPDNQVFFVVEESATFQGGDLNSFREWVLKNLIYPASAREQGITGKVIVQFCIDIKGDISDIKVIRGVNKDIDNEATRVIKSSPQWAPGKQGGKPVKQLFTIPVTFSLQ